MQFLMQRHESSPADTKMTLSECTTSISSLATAKHQELIGKPIPVADLTALGVSATG